MKSFAYRSVPGLLALSILSSAAAVHAEERPIAADGSGYLDFTRAPRLFGSGQVSHLGLSSLSVLLDSTAWSLGQILPRSLSLSAADGDILKGNVEAEYDPETRTIAGTVTFTGGTGRFEDATGSALLWIEFADSFNFDFALLGNINY